jgi:hypothetical protein
MMAFFQIMIAFKKNTKNGDHLSSESIIVTNSLLSHDISKYSCLFK